MSVVNKMLNDLEKRGGSASPSANYVPPVRQTRWRLLGWLLVIVVCVIAALLMAFPRDDEPTTAESLPLASQAPAETLPSASGEPDAVATSPSAPLPPSSQRAGEPSAGAAPVAGDIRPEQAEPQQQMVSDAPQQAAPGGQGTTSAPRSNSTAPSPAASLSVTSEVTASAPNAGLRERIRLALEQDQMLSAIALMKELYAREPENVALSKKLAATLFAEGQTEAARRLLTDSLVSNPQQHSVRLMLARLYVQQQQHNAALQVLNDAEAYPPVSLSLLAFRGELMRDRQRYDRARADYAQLTARDPGNARWWLGLAIAAEGLNKPAEARAAYQQALSLNQLGTDVATYMRSRLNALAETTP